MGTSLDELSLSQCSLGCSQAAASGEGSLELQVCEVVEKKGKRKGAPPTFERGEVRTLLVPRRPCLGDVRDAVCELYGWDDCTLLDLAAEDYTRSIEGEAQLVRALALCTAA